MRRGSAWFSGASHGEASAGLRAGRRRQVECPHAQPWSWRTTVTVPATMAVVATVTTTMTVTGDWDACGRPTPSLCALPHHTKRCCCRRFQTACVRTALHQSTGHCARTSNGLAHICRCTFIPRRPRATLVGKGRCPSKKNFTSNRLQLLWGLPTACDRADLRNTSAVAATTALGTGPAPI